MTPEVWQILGNIGQVGAAVAAAVAAIFAFRAVRNERDVISLDLLMRLYDHFNSDRFLDTRSSAATSLLEKDETGKMQEWDPDATEIMDVLNFLDWVAFLVNCRALDLSHVQETYGPRIRLYYLACEGAIEDVRSRRSPWRYEQLIKLNEQLRFDFREDHLKNFLERERKRGSTHKHVSPHT